MLKGFRAFILRGNVVDLAVAFVVGAAFTAIVTALVTDIINPLIAATVGKPDFSYLIVHMHGGAVKYGLFVNAVIYFLIVCAAMYFGVVLPLNKLMAKFHKAEPAAPPATKTCPQCLSEIPAAATRCAHCTQAVA
ncbi:MAG: large conductance mechanosensitive channel protein MscL [Acidobacteriaceae bacterium]